MTNYNYEMMMFAAEVTDAIYSHNMEHWSEELVEEFLRWDGVFDIYYKKVMER